MPVTFMEPKLGFPAQVDEICRETGETLSLLPTDVRRVTSVVRSLDQDMSDVGVAGMGDSTPMLRFTAGVLAARQSGEAHEGGSVVETPEVSVSATMVTAERGPIPRRACSAEMIPICRLSSAHRCRSFSRRRILSSAARTVER